jgi:hypothetical protein
MYLGNGRELLVRLSHRRLVAERDPKAAETLKDDAALGIGNDLDCAVAFGCLRQGIYV